MGIQINTNVGSLIVQRSLGLSSGKINTSLERLSTGYRINRAADDAAGLTISEALKSKANGSEVAQSNAQAGINLLQTAEGDLGIIQENLQRIRDLAVQAANGTNATAERNAIKDEVEQRTKEISRLSNSSTFNAINLLNGSNTTLAIQIGPNFSSTAVSLNSLTVGKPLAKADATSLGVNSTAGTFMGYYFGTATAAASFVSMIDKAISTVSSRRSTIGSLQNRLETTIQSLAVRRENMLASESRIRDVDVAKEAAYLTRNQILQQASSTLLAQANQSPNIALSLI